MKIVTDIFNVFKVSDKVSEHEGEFSIKDLCRFYLQMKDNIANTLVISDYINREIPLLITPLQQFYQQTNLAKEFLVKHYVISDHHLYKQDTLLDAIKSKVEEFHRQHSSCCIASMMDAIKGVDGIPFSISCYDFPQFNKNGEVIGSVIFIDDSFQEGERFIMIYDRNTLKGIQLNSNGTWEPLDLNLLDKKDILILKMKISNYPEKVISEKLEMSLGTVKARIRKMRDKYGVRTTRALIIKLRLLHILH